MPHYAHDRMELGAALRKLGADGMPETMGGCRTTPAGVDEPGCLAGLLDRRLEQIEAREQLAMLHEQVACGLAGELIDEGPFWTLGT